MKLAYIMIQTERKKIKVKRTCIQAEEMGGAEADTVLLPFVRGG